MHFMGALTCLRLKQFAAGAEHARQCLAKRDLPVLSPVNRDIRQAGPHHVLALNLWGAGLHDEVEVAFLKALAADAGARAARLDFARWLNERERRVDALNVLNQLVTGSEAEPHVWLLGARIALADPQLVEFACEWTGEAVNHQPHNAELAAAHAEALLLAGRAEEAFTALARTEAAGTPTQRAARLLAALGSEGELPAIAADEEAVVSREFIRWYRRLIEFRAETLLLKLNARVPELRVCLPSAAQLLTAAMAEAAPATN
jgi:tetratricopeptide (TPR) repeat protein